MFKWLGKILDSNEKQIRKLQPLVEEINSFEGKMKKLKKDEFAGKTAEFKSRLSRGETLDDLLPEAFALSREAIRRTVGERAFDVQLAAAIVLHQGRIAEQKTGEGKTLSAAIASYLNALSGSGVHIVTVNDYLARRDTGWYGIAHKLAGLEVGCIIHEQAFLLDPDYRNTEATDERLAHLRPVERKKAYEAEITYGTNNEFGFDYLRDNMVSDVTQCVQRGHHFAIVDEVDSILIDEARTPLIISAPDIEPTEKYCQFAHLIKELSPDTDYTIDEKLKTANLTEHGILKMEKKLGIKNLYEKDFETIHHIENALRAKTLYFKDRDYVVKDDQVIIVDEFTGRLMYGRRWSEGLHQAVEAKEEVKIQQESRTLATISFQNYFRMYKKLSGMTGTAATEAEEFQKIYGLDVVVVPTNEPMIRKDYPDVVYKSQRAKYAAIVSEIEKLYKKGRPVLVGTTSIEKNEIIHEFLRRKGIPHQILNAKHHEKEALIIANAGKVGAMTVATNMAGRGVDIVLGGAVLEDKGKLSQWKKEHDRIVKLGGLHVIGTERHESRRIDNQLRGRSGRQGDPGSSRFYLSLEDEIMRLFGGEQVANLMTIFKMPENIPLEHPMVSKAIEQAQVKVEGFNFDLRKRVVEYDDVMNKQREIIYQRRRKILELEKESGALKEKILQNLKNEVENLVEIYAPQGFEKIEYKKIARDFVGIIPFEKTSQLRLQKELEKIKDKIKVAEKLQEIIERTYQAREQQLGKDLMREMEKFVTLSTIDRLWMDHLDAIDNLREGIGLRGYAQKDPLVEYKKEAFEMFEQLLNSIDFEINHRIFRIQVQPVLPQAPVAISEMEFGRQDLASDLMGQQQTQMRQIAPTQSPGQVMIKPIVSGQKKVGRNEPCPCGSGVKYKRCCYPKYG